MNGSPVGEPSLILAIDFGTQSVRALAYDQGGSLPAKHQLPISNYQHPESGWTEHDVEGFWTLLSESCRGVVGGGLSVDPAEIAAVVVTTQRATVINLDELGQPLRPAIIWTDQRRAPPRGRLPWLWRMLFTLLRIRPIVENLEAETEANWLERHQPVTGANRTLLLLSGYLNYRLTGVFKDSVGSQVGYVPFDFKKQDWCADSDWKWHSMAIKRYMLPSLCAVGETLGAVTAEAAESTGLPMGIPVIAGAADKACEVLGVGALEAGVASVSCGTTATINTTRPKYVEVVPFMPAYPAALPKHFNTEIQVFRGFWMVSWFLEQFGEVERRQAGETGVAPETLLDALLAQTEPGANGLVLQPFWNPVLGETGPEGAAALSGSGFSHSRPYVSRGDRGFSLCPAFRQRTHRAAH